MKTLLLLFTALLFSMQPFQLFGQVSVNTIKMAPTLYKIKIGPTTAFASIGQDGIFLVDAGSENTGEEMLKAIREISNEDIKYLIYTHWHSDHTAGANKLEGIQNIISHVNVRPYLETKQIAQGDEYPALRLSSLPNLTITDKTTIYFNDEEIDLIPFLPGHTNGDVAVYFKKANILCAGDLFVPDRFPSIDYEHGGYAPQLLKNLQIIIDTFPYETKIVSAHGRDYTIDELKFYHSWLEKTLYLILEGYKKGETVEALIKKDILKEYPPSGDKTALRKNRWIEDVYNSLTNKK